MKVQKKYLLLIAGFVWAVAGFNILKLGLEAYPPYISVINFILSLLVFGIFMKFVFYKMVQKLSLIHIFIISLFLNQQFRVIL